MQIPATELSISEGDKMMQTVLITCATIAGLKLVRYVWSIIWEWA